MCEPWGNWEYWTGPEGAAYLRREAAWRASLPPRPPSPRQEPEPLCLMGGKDGDHCDVFSADGASRR